MDSLTDALADLPEPAARVLKALVETAREALRDDLVSMVLFGSAADGRLRPTSDLNVIVVLAAFRREAVDAMRESIGTGYAVARLIPMVVLESELNAAARAFSDKFADVQRRRRVLYGKDPFGALDVPRAARIARLEQVLLNATLRLREQYLLRSLREEQLVPVIAEAAGPLRADAATLLELEGKPAASVREALARVAASTGDASWEETLAQVSRAREERVLPPGVAGTVVLRLAELAERMRSRVAALAERA